MDWKLIDEATPRDRAILVAWAGNHYYHTAHWDAGRWCHIGFDWSTQAFPIQPTHWAENPSPPNR